MIAFIYPGQGSQKVGMGRELYEAYPEARAAFDEADAALAGEGPALSRVIFEGPEADLTLTETDRVALQRALSADAAVTPLQQDAAGAPFLSAFAPTPDGARGDPGGRGGGFLGRAARSPVGWGEGEGGDSIVFQGGE